MTSAYQQQLQAKVERISAQFQTFQPPHLEVFESPETNFRMRAEFRIWHTENDFFYAMFERDDTGKNKKAVRVDQLPIASTDINILMPILLQELKQEKALHHRLFEIDFLGSLSGEMLVTLIYHHKLDEQWQQLAHTLAKKLNIKIIGRSRGQKLILSDDFVVEKIEVDQKIFQYKQIENGFTQPNAIICQKMLQWASDVANTCSGDLLELYCGNGNFTLPLAQKFPKVLATELAKSSVYAAEWNIQTNRINNIAIARLAAEEFTQAYTGERTFRRLQEANIELSDYDFGTIFVDPPRAGIDTKTLQLMQNFHHIIYISCNPDTLAENLQTLCQTHRIVRFALFDQFPYTHHVESGILLEKR
ncbi:tRNA (uridine(54)-C5)-methyltransferase TrmA [Acinetobacter sp. B5B]|uniref:tRNA (uridine(54)-C5)-methyltransferase TrmA n=1 Tax=Acinetobacter baretiae TaxID=2605383 RepID=UPI0018C1DC46|nr:tRNA (uridine(54)-C5)-methyltransferase TrmA [Acinetobacter baretiae]MBF7682713.1 tRNA (uridine(54)-C5)-methyltransferase TrmA [Acinetobacter baretiae]MBF7684947.1 tRNA (uridine(54)-C5)-methyltransferase TrmA [Acinetobacter baretiae]